MRDYSKISPKVWRSARFRSLTTEQAKNFYLFALSCDHQSSAGCFRLPDAYAAADLNWSQEQLEAARAMVIAAELIVHDPATEEYFVLRWFKHNPAHNPKHRKGVERIISELDSDIVREIAEAEYQESCPVNPLDTPLSPSWPARNGSHLANSQYLRGDR